MRKKLFSVSITDCRVDTFTVAGPGGGGKDTSNTGVRITHLPSKAVGKSSDTRRQSKNKQLAFVRMGKSKEFQIWARVIACTLLTGKSIEDKVNEAMVPANIKVEVQENGIWVAE